MRKLYEVGNLEKLFDIEAFQINIFSLYSAIYDIIRKSQFDVMDYLLLIISRIT